MPLCFDISQFVSQPAASGIQRVLQQIALQSNGDDRFAFHDGERTWLLTPDQANTMLRGVFDRSIPTDRPLADWVRDRSLGTMSTESFVRHFDGYVFTELTYDLGILNWWRHLAEHHQDRVGAVFYDAAPETSRQLFGSQAPAGGSSYFRFVAAVERVACISHAAKDQLDLLARHRPRPALVAPLGADHLPTSHAPPAGTVVIVGDLKTKKRTTVALDAFDQVSQEIPHRLIIVGSAIRGEERVRQRVERSVQEHGGRVTWLAGVADEVLADSLCSADVSVFIAGDEGFGLPALEALHAGVPVIADAELPSLRYVGDGGVIALDEVNADTVADALRRIAGPDGQALRAAAAAQRVPTWGDFVASIRGMFAT